MAGSSTDRKSYRGVMLPAYKDRDTDPAQEATAVIGLGLGDECKGMTVAHEAGRAVAKGCAVLDVRFNGGAQAAHNVTVRTTDGRLLHHTHSQFGSATMLGAETLLGPGMLVSPIALAREADALAALTGDAAIESRLLIDHAAPVLLPLHSKANRMLETMRADARHGSTGLGIGVARTCEAAVASGDVDPSMLVTVGTLATESLSDIQSRIAFWAKWVSERFGVNLSMGREECEEDADWLASVLRQVVGRGARVLLGDEARDLVRERLADGFTSVVFEGSQGAMLDERFGWFPHVTYGDMTADGARALAGEGARLRTLGVTRCYQTRHGAGPFPSEGTFDAPERHNGDGEWTGGFRTGLLDVPMLSAGAAAIRPDEVAVSCLDRWPGHYVSAWEGERDAPGIRRPIPFGPVVSECDEEGVLDVIGCACGDVPVSVVGCGEVTTEWGDR